jgi:Ran GTPase-activating protein (RanGAP) involved in mRNA processing and transport
MDYSGNKTSVGQERILAETESIIRMHLSKDGYTLDLTAVYLKEYGAKDIARMEFLRPLTSLAFGTNLCGSKGVKYIAQSEVLVNLTTLNLFYNQIGNEGVQYIALSDNLLSLQNLVITDNGITDEGALLLAKFLPLFTNLVRLDLRLNRIRDEGKDALKEAQKVSNVKHLLLDKVEGFQVKG